MTVAFYFIIIFFSNSDDSITKQLRQTFMENLLGTYRELERSFMENIYELQKAFGFQTLWKLDDVISSLRRIASESAFGTGRLNGAVQLQNVLTRVQRIKSKAKRCFTRLKYSTNVQRWSFNNTKDKQVKVFKYLELFRTVEAK